MCRKRDSSEEEEEGQAQDHDPGRRTNQVEEVTLPREALIDLPRQQVPAPAGGRPTLRPGPLTGLPPRLTRNQLTSQDLHPLREGPQPREPKLSLREGFLTTRT